jgi:serine protease AprX
VSATAAVTAGAGVANQGLDRSNGLGSLDASRGTVRVQTTNCGLLGCLLGTLITGSYTAQLLLWDPLGFSTGSWAPATWYTSTFYLSPWHTVTWSGTKWNGTKWNGTKWNGTKWNGTKWNGGEDPSATYGSTWHGSAWYGAWE